MKTNFLIFALLLTSCFSTAVFAQPNPDTLWTCTYGGSGIEYARSIQQTTDGGYVMGGYTSSFGAGDYDFYVVKTDSQGDTLWTQTYGGSGDDEANSIQQTRDGGYVIAGFTSSFGAGSCDFYVVKTNNVGTPLWTGTYGGSGWDGAYCIQQTTDNGYVVAGHTGSFGAGSRDCYVVKTNSQGDTLWTRTYGGGSGDYAFSIQQTADGGYVLVGNTRSFGVGNGDCYLVKTNSQGDTLWTRIYGGVNYDEAWSIQQTTDGGYVIAGYTNSFGAGSDDCYVVKTNSQGDTLWTRTYGGSNIDMALSIEQTIDGGYVLTGLTNYGTANPDCYVVKTDGQGNSLWTRTYGGSSDDDAFSILQTTDGGYVIAGYTSSFGAGGDDFYIVKTGPDPCFQSPPVTPQIVLTTAGEDTHLNWQPVTQSIGGCPINVSRYLVFYSPTSEGPFYYHGYTMGTSYVHLGVVSFAPGMFYQVIAFVGAPTLVDELERGTVLEDVMEQLGITN